MYDRSCAEFHVTVCDLGQSYQAEKRIFHNTVKCNATGGNQKGCQKWKNGSENSKSWGGGQEASGISCMTFGGDKIVVRLSADNPRYVVVHLYHVHLVDISN